MLLVLVLAGIVQAATLKLLATRALGHKHVGELEKSSGLNVDVAEAVVIVANVLQPHLLDENIAPLINDLAKNPRINELILSKPALLPPNNNNSDTEEEYEEQNGEYEEQDEEESSDPRISYSSDDDVPVKGKCESVATYLSRLGGRPCLLQLVAELESIFEHDFDEPNSGRRKSPELLAVLRAVLVVALADPAWKAPLLLYIELDLSAIALSKYLPHVKVLCELASERARSAPSSASSSSTTNAHSSASSASVLSFTENVIARLQAVCAQANSFPRLAKRIMPILKPSATDQEREAAVEAMWASIDCLKVPFASPLVAIMQVPGFIDALVKWNPEAQLAGVLSVPSLIGLIAFHSHYLPASGECAPTSTSSTSPPTSNCLAYTTVVDSSTTLDFLFGLLEQVKVLEKLDTPLRILGMSGIPAGVLARVLRWFCTVGPETVHPTDEFNTGMFKFLRLRKKAKTLQNVGRVCKGTQHALRGWLRTAYPQNSDTIELMPVSDFAMPCLERPLNLIDDSFDSHILCSLHSAPSVDLACGQILAPNTLHAMELRHHEAVILRVVPKGTMLATWQLAIDMVFSD